MKKDHFPTLIALAFMCIFWSTTPVAIAFVKDEFSMMFQIWTRYLSSILLLWFLILINRDFRKDLFHFFSRPLFFWVRLSITAGFTILFQLGFTYCFFLIAPGFGMLLYQCQVLFSLLLGVVFFPSERALMKNYRTISGMILAVSGAVIVILFQSGGVEFGMNLGIIMALGAALAWSCVGVSLRKGLKDEFSPVFTVTMVFTLVVIYLAPVTFLMEGDLITGTPRPVHWAALCGSGLLGIAGGQGIYYFLLPRLGLITTSSVQLLVPFLTGFFSFLLFREIITPLQLAGGVVLLLGCRIILVQKAKMNV